MKTRNLSSAALDWVVAKGEGYRFVRIVPGWTESNGLHVPTYITVSDKAFGFQEFSPSTDWASGGPIIERERITIKHVTTLKVSNQEIWKANIRDASMTGLSPLIVAMRCYVVSNFGDDVELPEVLADKEHNK